MQSPGASVGPSLRIVGRSASGVEHIMTGMFTACAIRSPCAVQSDAE